MIVAMQVLWREALEGNRPIIVDEFLYCYKPSEIKKSAGFYQFSSRGPYFSLIKGRSSSDRLWKTEFFIISGDWAGDLIDVNSAPFPPFTSPLGRLRPEGKYFLQKNSYFFFYGFTFTYSSNPSLFCIGAAVIRPHLDRFYLDRIDQVRFFSDRSFHGLVTFSRLAAWGLSPIPTTENLGHEETTQRSKCRPFLFSFFLPFFFFFFFL